MSLPNGMKWEHEDGRAIVKTDFEDRWYELYFHNQSFQMHNGPYLPIPILFEKCSVRHAELIICAIEAPETLEAKE